MHFISLSYPCHFKYSLKRRKRLKIARCIINKQCIYLYWYKNAALVWLGLPSTLIRHENEALRKRSSNRGNLKTPVFRFRVHGKHFENGPFSITNDHVISLTEFFKIARDCYVFKIPPASCGRKTCAAFSE